MTKQRLIPDNPLSFIQSCVRAEKLFWSYHVNMRMRERGISRDMVLKSEESFELIESYPEDKYLPSYLVYAVQHDNQVFHVLFAVDVEEKHVRVITVYYPNAMQWRNDLKARRS
ncbi:DUF4258 domain-containing protein [Mariprofundus ferrooxydans]|nr:DUF4258 domain-containing protein [Mariprofundus ferrooxydans]